MATGLNPGDVLVKKVNGSDDWVEEVLDASDVPVTITGANYVGAGISGTESQELFNSIADRLGDMSADYNLVIGGDFSTNPFQRVTSITNVQNLDFVADRFRFFRDSSSVIDTVKSTDVPTLAESDLLLTHSLSFTTTTAQASFSSNQFLSFDTGIEGGNFKKIAQKIFTVSFWVKATVTGTYSLAFLNTGADRSYVSTYTIDSSNTWEKKEIVVLASPSSGTWDYTSGLGLRVRFTLAAATGSSLGTSSVNQWLTGNFQWSTSQVNTVASVSNSFKLSALQIEEGEFSTQFQERDVQKELLLCQRYFVKSGSTSNTIINIKLNNDVCGSSLRFPVRMRVTPTVSLFNGSGSAGNVFGFNSGNISGVTAGLIDQDGFGYVSKTSGFSGDAAVLYNYQADGEVI